MNHITLSEAKRTISPGWHRLLNEAYRKKPLRTKIINIKEKYGALRIDTLNETPRYSDYLWRLENRSTRVCDICGAIGKVRKIEGWFVARCDVHSTKLVWRD